MNPGLALLLAATGIGLFLLALRIQAHLKYIAACGTALSPSPVVQRLVMRLAKLLRFVQVGPISLHGADRLKAPGPLIIAANHPHFADAAVLPVVINGPARYLVAGAVLRFCQGLGALVLGRAGVLAVDLNPGKGAPALRTALRLLTEGERLVIFPEGWAHLAGQTAPFKRGVAFLAQQAARTLGHPVPVIPVFLRYGRYPGPRIERFNPRLQYLLVLLGFWYYRRGVTVVVGEPIPVTAESGNVDAVTRLLQDRILSLDPEFHR